MNGIEELTNEEKLYLAFCLAIAAEQLKDCDTDIMIDAIIRKLGLVSQWNLALALKKLVEKPFIS
ncbi:MAG: hypothetical protein MUD14_09740 [Hydrococcus sp. Prado102]|jgi:hypothetical protein|nr:hypothetical protein [Hydrococcus sp. Prado102]